MKTIEDQTKGQDGPRWFVAQTNRAQERLARDSLRSEGIEVYLPMYLNADRVGSVRALPFFPGYLFFRIERTAPQWSLLFSARGILAILGNGGRPMTVPDWVIEDIRGQEVDGMIDLGVAKPAEGFKRGDPVRISKGRKRLVLDGVFVERLDKHRALVLVRLLGDAARLVQAELAHLEVNAGADAIQHPATLQTTPSPAAPGKPAGPSGSSQRNTVERSAGVR